MDLNPDKKTIAEIFPLELNVTYNVPIYQRNYAWKEDNIETLINDIIAEDQGYYLGNFIVTEYKDRKDFYDIVDGQQRVTTIALIYLATYQLLEEYQYYDKVSKLKLKESISVQGRIKDKLLKSNKKPQLDLLPPDKKLYEDLLESLKEENDVTKNYKPHKNRVLGKRFDYVREYLKIKFFVGEDYENEIDEGITNLINFYNDLNYAEILRIRVPNLNDAFTIFTSFNAKGVPLTLIDLFKSFYLKTTDGKLTQEEAMDKWEDLLSLFYNDNEEPNSSVVTQFLLNYYDTFESTTSSSITQNSALKVYEKLFSENGFTYIYDLTLKAKIFSNITNKLYSINDFGFDEHILKLLTKLDKLNTTQVYPVLLYTLSAYYEERITNSLLVDLLEFLVTYYVRRNITLKPKASNIRARTLKAVRKLQEIDIIEISDIKEVKNSLLAIAVSDEEFKSALSGPVYEISKNTVRIMLIDLEKKHGTFFNSQVIDSLDSVDDKGRYVWTLEHILPQSAINNNNWRVMLEEKANNEDQIPILLETNVHKIGNLTLTGYNSEMSARSFTAKRDYRDKKTNVETGLKTKIFLNESLTEKDKNINEKNSWSIDDINRRTEYLINKILPIYQYN